MRLIFDACVPRKDVLSGELREEMFAAHLRDVIRDEADPIYRKPEVFFDRTYPTGGLPPLGLSPRPLGGLVPERSEARGDRLPGREAGGRTGADSAEPDPVCLAEITHVGREGWCLIARRELKDE
jgi:hypothetical protein